MQIWRCAFEPHPENEGKWTDIVATCGGSYICLIDCRKGECKAKLLQHEDQYFDVLWSTVQFADGVNTNVLAAAGELVCRYDYESLCLLNLLLFDYQHKKFCYHACF